MAQLGEILEKLFTTAGIDTDNPEIIKVLQNGEVFKAVVPDTEANKFDTLITLDSAKHNSTLKGHFKAQALNGVDATLKALLEDIEDEDVRNEILSIQGTEKKIPALINKVRELEAKKANVKPVDKSGVQAEIDKLNKQITDLTQSYQVKETQLTESFSKQLLDQMIQSQLGSFNYADGIPKDVQILTAKNLLERELNNKKIKLTKDEFNNIVLKQSDNPELDYMENNKKMNFGDLASSLLANNKMLKVANPTPTPAPTGNPTPTPIANNEAFNLYEEQLQTLAK